MRHITYTSVKVYLGREKRRIEHEMIGPSLT
jgi:hypothetical protein